MIFPHWLTVYGDTSFRGECAVEDAEHTTFVNAVRRRYPKAAAVMIHAQNEGKRTASQAQWDKARGMNAGVADFVFVGSPSLVIEMKRRDHTKSHWQKGQQEFLKEAMGQGATVCVALGWDAALEEVRVWQDTAAR